MHYVYFPLYVYYVWLAIKARSLWFWSSSNPGIETGGMLGESKIKIFNVIPDAYKPVTLLIPSGTPLSQVLHLLNQHELTYPLICKPDRGERGFQVSKIRNEKELAAYIERNRVEYLIQPFCSYPVEMGIYYRRFPWEKTGSVFSIVQKEFLCITGDGKSTMRQLIINNDRALLQYEKLEARFGNDLDSIPSNGFQIELEPIGNHARGTTFINGNHLIDDKINRVFDEITSHIPDVYFCRYDLKTSSIDALKAGKNIVIVELNGVGAEPAHIYDPSYRLIHAWRDLIHQWSMVYKISVYNKKHGHPYMSTKAVRSHLKLMKAYRILAES